MLSVIIVSKLNLSSTLVIAKYTNCFFGILLSCKVDPCWIVFSGNLACYIPFKLLGLSRGQVQHELWKGIWFANKESFKMYSKCLHDRIQATGSTPWVSRGLDFATYSLLNFVRFFCLPIPTHVETSSNCQLFPFVDWAWIGILTLKVFSILHILEGQFDAINSVRVHATELVDSAAMVPI